MHLLTVTGNNAVSDAASGLDEIEDCNEVLYKTCKAGMPLNFDKQTIFISSRVHCGETIASFFL